MSSKKQKQPKKMKKTMKKKAKKAPPKGPAKGARARNTGRRLGEALGYGLLGPAGSSIGGLLGRAAGNLFHKVTGMGDYKVENNTLMGAADSLPAFSSGRDTVVVHREYLGDVLTSPTVGQFYIQTYPIQAALVTTFPWFSNVAQQWEAWELLGCIFEFKSNSYDALASTNTASGTVVMTTQYNVLAPQFVNKQQMEQYAFTCSGKPSRDLLHPVECKRTQSILGLLNTRAGALPDGGDLQLYDHGNFSIATVGMQGASTNIGELWVTYHVRLVRPRLGLSTDLGDHYVLNNVTGTGSYFGTPVLSPASNFGTTLTSDGKSIVLPPTYAGNFAVVYQIVSNSASVTGAELAVTTAGDPVVPLYLFSGQSGNAATNQITAPIGTQMLYDDGKTGTGYTIVALFTTTGGGKIGFSGGAIPTAGTIRYSNLFVISMPSTLFN
jgi:hypothetical protein